MQGRVGAFDLNKLCASVPEFEFLWSCHLSENVQVVSFIHNIGQPEWLTMDISETRRNGMIEAWTLTNGQHLHNSIWDFEPDTKLPPSTNHHWIWHSRFQCKAVGRPAQWSIKIKTWTAENEWQSIALLDKKRRMAPDCHFHFVSCDQSRVAVEFQDSGPEGATKLLCTTQGQKSKSMSIEHNGDTRLTCLARGTPSIASKGGYWGRAHELLLAAGDGRLIYANVFNHKVITF